MLLGPLPRSAPPISYPWGACYCHDMYDMPSITRRRKVHSAKTIVNPVVEWIDYLERHKTLDYREIQALRVMAEELESRAMLLAEHWYERGKGENRLF